METIKEAKANLRENWEKGLNCPCCGQHVQLYRYPLFMTSAIALIELYKASYGKVGDAQFLHVTEYAEAKGDRRRAPHFAELRFWGLIEQRSKKTKDENATGYWRITEKGIAFALGKLTVDKYIKVFNNHLVSFDGEQIDIKKALGNKFDYEEIMNGYGN